MKNKPKGSQRNQPCAGCGGSTVAKRKNDFDEFMNDVAKESVAAGQTEAFEAYGEHFRLALQVIRLRKEQNWTQQQLAKASGVQQSEISRIERGQANPTFRTRRKAKALQVPGSGRQRGRRARIPGVQGGRNEVDSARIAVATMMHLFTSSGY